MDSEDLEYCVWSFGVVCTILIIYYEFAWFFLVQKFFVKYVIFKRLFSRHNIYYFFAEYEAMSAQVEITTASAVDEFTEYETTSVLVEIANTSSASQWNALVLILVCCITGAIVW